MKHIKPVVDRIILAIVNLGEGNPRNVYDYTEDLILNKSEATTITPASSATLVTVLPVCESIATDAFKAADTGYNPSGGVDLSNATSLTSIGDNAFGQWTNANIGGSNSYFNRLVIPPTVTTIDGWAFDNWTSQESIIDFNPSTSVLTTIGQKAFARWTSAYINTYMGVSVRVVIPPTVTTIGVEAFENWTSHVNGFDFNYGTSQLTTIGARAFKNSGSNKFNLSFPTSLTSIGSESFSGWTDNTFDLACPAIHTIPYYAFYNWINAKGSTETITIKVGYESLDADYHGYNSGGPWDEVTDNGFTGDTAKMTLNVDYDSKGIYAISRSLANHEMKIKNVDRFGMDNGGSWKHGYFLSKAKIESQILTELTAKHGSATAEAIMDRLATTPNDVTLAPEVMLYTWQMSDGTEHNTMRTDDWNLQQSMVDATNPATHSQRLKHAPTGIMWSFKWSGENGCSSINNNYISGGKWLGCNISGGYGMHCNTSKPCGNSDYPDSGGNKKYFAIPTSGRSDITVEVPSNFLVPLGVYVIEQYAFANWNSYEGMPRFGSNVSDIGNNAFANWYSVTGKQPSGEDHRLTIQSGVTTIGSEAFVNMGGNGGALQSETINTIEFRNADNPTMGWHAFHPQNGLTKRAIIVPSYCTPAQIQAYKDELDGTGDLFSTINGVAW